MKAIVSSAVYLPRKLVDVSAIKKQLTVDQWKLGARHSVKVYEYIDYEDYLAVPRAFGLKLISKLGIKAIDRMVDGQPFSFPKEVTHTGDYAYQEAFVQEILGATERYNDFLVEAATGKGKCLAKGTPVLMFDGRVLPVEKVRVGDRLMGPDSTPRTVASLAHGEEEMFRVTPTKGDHYTVNRSHILSLRITGMAGKRISDSLGRLHSSGDIVDISVDDYLASSATFRHCAKGWRTGVEFTGAMETPIPAYILGSWLGDGSSRYPMLFNNDEEVVQEWRRYAASVGLSLSKEPCGTVGTYRVSSGDPQQPNQMMRDLRELNLLQNKHIPDEYLTACRNTRLEVLAGLVDTDGCISCGCFDLVFVNERLANDTAYLARSLGMAAYVYPCRKRCTNTDVWGDYFRIRISGELSVVPCRIPRKRAALRTQKKDVSSVGISVSSVGVGEYFGFVLDGDRRFLLGDFTVTHNTVCALSVIQKLGCNALVLVDQDNLANQWHEQAKAVLGLTDDQIGRVQADKCSYEGKGVTISTLQSLSQKDYPEKFYEHFGVVVLDEAHTAVAPTFSKVLMLFSARTRFGVSATIDRRDALQKILHDNFGAVQVELTDTHDASYVYCLNSPTVYSWYANISPKVGRILSEIAEDTNRNMLIAKGIVSMYSDGRDILVISDRIEQLEDIRSMCHYAGIPVRDTGLYCGYKTVFGFIKNPKPKRRPFGYVRGTEYTPVHFVPARKKIPKKVLEATKGQARVLFATFGMFSKGVDVPRLSAGFDCTPRSKAQQVHGRILRKVEGKLTPIWVTVRDYNSYRLEYQFLQRIGEYVESSAEIYTWEIQDGAHLLDVRELKREVHENIKELKALNILTQLDGRCILGI